jgi:hypothetical protein
MKFGTRRQTKLALAAEILQKFGGLAERCGDRIGLVLFSDRIEKFFPPRRSAKVFQCAIAGTALSNRKKGTDAANAMNFLRRVIKKRSVVIFLTDIFALASGRKAMMSKLHQLGTRHNTFIVAISDGGDMLRSGIGRVMVEDGESGEMLEIDGDDGQLMEKIHGKCSAYFDLIFMDIGKIGVGALEVNTAYNCDDFLFAFLNKCRTMGGAGTGRWTMKKHGRR